MECEPSAPFCLPQMVVESSAHRIIQLAAQWEKHRVPLIQEFRELKALHDSKEVILAKSVREALLGVPVWTRVTLSFLLVAGIITAPDGDQGAA